MGKKETAYYIETIFYTCPTDSFVVRLKFIIFMTNMSMVCKFLRAW